MNVTEDLHKLTKPNIFTNQLHCLHPPPSKLAFLPRHTIFFSNLQPNPLAHLPPSAILFRYLVGK